MTASVRFRATLALLVFVVAASCTASADPVASRPRDQATEKPAPTPISYAVRLGPEQIILPPEEFPIPGYSVDKDERVSANQWTRRWSGPEEYFWVRVYVTVLGASTMSRDVIAATTCDWTFSPAALRAAEVTAPVVGDGAKACGYDFTDLQAGSLVYTTGTRNVLVTVGVYRRSATREAAAAFIASLADYQLWTVDRVAPVAGTPLRSAPRVERNTAVLRTPPPPSQAPPPSQPTPAPVAVDVNPKSVDLGPHGGCGGAILQQRFDISAPPDVNWTVSWAGAGDTSGGVINSFDHPSGSGLGSATFTITLAPQKPSSSYSSCSLTTQFLFGDTLTFLFSRGGVPIKRIVTTVKYEYIGVV